MVVPFVRQADTTKPTAQPGRPADASHNTDPVPLVGNTDPWAWLLAASLKIDLWKLARFNELMGRHHQPVHLGRIFRDPAYAFERLSAAHATGDKNLKTLALELFEQYLELERRRRSPDFAASPFARH